MFVDNERYDEELDILNSYWCCNREFGKHDVDCPNYKEEVLNPPMGYHWE